VERAKALLLEQNRRVSEVAYDAGFQSLTHFNRIFRRFVGTSPSDFREHLAHA
jgi:AraC-like DNA-binding protein